MSDEKFELEEGRVMAVITEAEMDCAGVELSGKARLKVAATVGGGILTKYDVRNIVKRWVSAGCPDAIKHNETANRMRQNAVNKEQEHIRVCGELCDVREEKRAIETELGIVRDGQAELMDTVEKRNVTNKQLGDQIDALRLEKGELDKRLEETKKQLRSARDIGDQLETSRNKLIDFIKSAGDDPFFKRLWLALSKKHFKRVYEEIME